jgi:hypothetical protein
MRLQGIFFIIALNIIFMNQINYNSVLKYRKKVHTQI